MINKNNISVFIFLMLLITSEAFGQDVPPRNFELFAARKEGSVQLYWDCRYWGSEMAGFMIMRSEAGKEQWVMLTDAPLIPAIDPAVSFTNRGLNEEQLRSLQIDFHQFIMQGDLSEVSPLTMGQILTAQSGPGSGDRIKMKNDFRLALIVGFGFIDNTAIEGVSYDYALYAAFTDGTVGSSPLDLFRLGYAPPTIPLVEFTSGREIITLHWDLSETEVRMNSILGYLVHRTDPDGSNPEVIANQPVGSFRTTGGITYFRVNDHKADPTLDYLYTLTPVNVFQTQGAPFQAHYTAGRYRPITPPVIDMVTLYEDEFMEVIWDFNPDDVPLLKSFVLELSGDPGKEEGYTIIDTIAPTERNYVDMTPKAYGEIYFYHLRALGHYGQDVVSTPEAFYYMGLMTPPGVTGLSGRLVQRENGSFVHLQWDPKRGRDTVTLGYAIYTDELLPDSFLHLSAIPLIENNEYLFPISTRGGRPYRFRVAGISQQGRSGVPGEVTLNIGTLHLPRVLHITSQRLHPSGLLLRWEYPAFTDLAGFRLLMDGREVAGVEAITGDMRSYLVPEELLTGTVNPTFRLVAVGSVAVSEPGMAHNLYMKPGTPPRFPAPASLTWELLESGDRKAVQLCWEPPFGMEKEVGGYALFADYATAGRLQRLNTVPVLSETTYIYTLPDGVQREGITLGISVVTQSGETGIISEIYIPIQHINKEKINNDTP